MARFAFLCEFKQKVENKKKGTTSTQKAVTVFSCIDRVAKALDLDTSDRVLKFDVTQTRKKAAYDKMVWEQNASGDWIQTKKSFAASDVPFIFSAKAKSQKITLYLRGKGVNLKAKRQLTLTAPATLNIGQIADALGDLIPASKRGTSASDIDGMFSVNRGPKHLIPTKADADATPDVNVPETASEAKTIISTADPQVPA
jgi:hypothetical protein